ncbi:MAG: RNA polymerase sigma factor SigZ [Bacteroidetes bacterium]|nr:RNA polymerase sigma factor SigZ [Bacteroidota bacterium]
MTTTTENIWAQFHKELHRFINKRIKDADAANDILQDIFIKIHLKLNTLTDAEKLTAWVYQIARNSILDYYKKQKPQAEFTENLKEIVDDEAFKTELSTCLIPMIEELPADYKDAIMQTELGDLSQKEYAEKLGISYSGTKSRVQRARQQLHDLFNQCCTIETDKYGNIIDHICHKDCGCE